MSLNKVKYKDEDFSNETFAASYKGREAIVYVNNKLNNTLNITLKPSEVSALLQILQEIQISIADPIEQ